KNSAGCKYAVDNGFDYVLLDADEVEIIPGDANGDGEVTVMDVLLIRQSLAGWSIEINELAADVDANGVVNVLDVLLIRQSLAGWNVVLRTKA
ncbi:MAG: dockerin type I repeat-containing protein, partial [Ruminococcus sp.]|nr:dockerin type I repeat-containing protein [Ruminococcus sp.]